MASGPGLFAACYNREPGAWEEFLAKYSKLIYFCIHKTCRAKSYFPEQDELEDLFNDVLVNFIKNDCKKLRQFRGDSGCSEATWIRTVTVRFTIDYLRQGARGASLVNIEEDATASEASLQNPVSRPDQVFEEREKQRQLNRAIKELPESDRRFIELYYVSGLSPEEVARVLQISVKTVYSRVNRIKGKISKVFSEDARKGD